MKALEEHFDPTEYAVETVEFFLHMDRYITKNYGVRCPEHVTGCVTCDMWKLRDGMAAIAIDNG